MCLFSVFLLGPLVLVVVFSVNANEMIAFPMGGLSLRWYEDLLNNPEFYSSFKNALTIAIPVAIISAVTGTSLVYAVTTLRIRGGNTLLGLISLPVLLPPLIIAISLVVFYVRLAHIPLGLHATISGHVVITQPFVIAVMMARMASFDFTVLDAARDLGATAFQAFMKVTLPQIRTAIIGAALIAFALSLDEFIITVFTISGGNTLSTFVWGKLKTSLDPSMNAIATVILVITVTLTLISLRLSRYRG
jgi:spermidine/putrescine transport system permease protein